MKKRFLVLLFLILVLSGLGQAQSICNQSAVINVSAGSTGTLVAAVPGVTVYVCGFLITGNTAATGAQFQTGSTNLTGVMLMPVNGNLSYSGYGQIFQSTVGGTISLAATTGAVTGVLSFRQQ